MRRFTPEATSPAIDNVHPQFWKKTPENPDKTDQLIRNSALPTANFAGSIERSRSRTESGSLIGQPVEIGETILATRSGN
jgi:hypothetical protein